MNRSLWLWVAVLGCGSSGGPITATSVSPAQGSARGGDEVVIAGTGFGDQTTVRIGGQAARVKKVSPEALTVVTPRLVAGPATVELESGGYKAKLSGGFVYQPVSLAFVDAAAQALPPLPVDGAAVKLADLDRDGDLDVLQAARAEGLLLYENLGTTTFAAPTALAVGPADGGAGYAVRDVVAADFDGDGQLDVFLGTTGRAPSQLLRGDGHFGFSTLPLPPLFGVDQTAVASDLDGDGDLDLISMGASATADGAPQVRLLFNDGLGTFTDLTQERLAGAAFDAAGAAAGDLDGDGHLDLFFAGSTEASRLYLGDGRGTFARAAPDALPFDSVPHGGIPAVGDLNGDGALDLVLPTAAQDRVLFNDGSGHFDDVSTIFLGAESGPSVRALLSDLDLDGHLDLIVVDQPGRVRLYRNDGKGRLFDYSGELVGNDAALPAFDAAVGDLDGDGDDDLFVSRSEVTRPSLFLNWSPSRLADDDTDGDLYPDRLDNCPAIGNPDQAHSEAEPFGCRSGAACAAATGCELGVHGASAYLFCRDAPLAWAAAQSKCKARGGNLVSISNPGEEAYLLTHSGGAQAWVGFQDQATENSFGWVSGEDAGFVHWAAAQPDNANNEDCVALIGANGWNDDNCATVKGYICEAARTPTTTALGDACRGLDAGM